VANFREKMSWFWNSIQLVLLPFLNEELDYMTDKHRQLVVTLETIHIEDWVGRVPSVTGRPLSDRATIARSFVAKAVLGIETTEMLMDRLRSDKTLRRICGWEARNQLPSSSTMSRAFAEFSKSQLPAQVHAVLIHDVLGEQLLGHVARDSMEIEGREKPRAKTSTTETTPVQTTKRRRGRPKKGEVVEPVLSRLSRQLAMPLGEMLDELPKECDVGCKRNSKGHTETWIGYKLHIDTLDNGTPVSSVVTSASVHDSQVAIPLMCMTSNRVTYLYDVMDSAYDSELIRSKSISMNHIPLIDKNLRRDVKLRIEMSDERRGQRLLGIEYAVDARYKERTVSERTNSRMRGEFGADNVYVRGNCKVSCHLAFGLLALAADQIVRLLI